MAGSLDPTAEFDPVRNKLMRVAYRMLGSVSEAEDMVQEAFIRWMNADRSQVSTPEAFLRRTAYMRKTNTPVWVGEFGPVYTGDPARDEQCAQLLADQLDIYRRHEASWSIWTYKDVGLQGLVHTAPHSTPKSSASLTCG